VYDEVEVGVPLDVCTSVKLGLSQQGKAGSVRQQSAEKDTSIWVKEGGGNRRLEKSFVSCTEHIVRVIISRERRHVGYVACVCGRRDMHTRGFWKLEGKRPLGGSRY
jgi:hypothetical protein